MINSVHCYLGGGVPGGGVVPQETVQMTRDYCGNHIYRNDSLERVLMPSGHLDAQGAFHAYIKDYQGNVRVVVAPDGSAAEVNHYYPYGMLMAAEAGVQPHKYGGKELDRQNGLDWYDSQARWYDPATGRTTTMDPKAEEYPAISPYAWCAGNPVRFVDPTGEEFTDRSWVYIELINNYAQIILSDNAVALSRLSQIVQNNPNESVLYETLILLTKL